MHGFGRQEVTVTGKKKKCMYKYDQLTLFSTVDGRVYAGACL